MPCKAVLGVPETFFVDCAAYSKMNGSCQPSKKILFVTLRRSEMILNSHTLVNVANNILGYKKSLEAKFYNRLLKKYKDQLEFNLKTITI